MCHKTLGLHDQRGVVAVLAALFLPVVLLLLAVLVDAGLLMVRREKLKATAVFAAQAGGTMVSDIIVEKATAHNPPPDATDPLLYLTDDDRVAIGSDPRVGAAVQTYIDANRAGIAEAPTVTIRYPDNTISCTGTRDEKHMNLRVAIEETIPILFSPVLFGKQQSLLRATAVQSVPLCP